VLTNLLPECIEIGSPVDSIRLGYIRVEWQDDSQEGRQATITEDRQEVAVNAAEELNYLSLALIVVSKSNHSLMLHRCVSHPLQ